jgi:hypothetical protein
VPETLSDCTSLGLDVEEWARQGFIDEIVGGRGYFEFFPLTELTAMAHRYGVRVYANNNRLDAIEVSRAWAQMHWQTGVDGLLLFYHYKEGRFPFVHEIGRPERIARLSKTYKVNRKVRDLAIYIQFRSADGLISGRSASTDVEPNHPIHIHIDCYDEITAAAAAGVLKQVAIRLFFKTKVQGREDMFEFLTASLTPEDRFSIRVNGSAVPPDRLQLLRPLSLSGVDAPYKLNTIYGLEWLQPVSTVRTGAHDIEIELLHKNPHIKNSLVLDGAELQLDYH